MVEVELAVEVVFVQLDQAYVVDVVYNTNLALRLPSKLNELIKLLDIERKLVAIRPIGNDLSVLLFIKGRYLVESTIKEEVQVVLRLAHRDQCRSVQEWRCCLRCNTYLTNQNE